MKVFVGDLSKHPGMSLDLVLNYQKEKIYFGRDEIKLLKPVEVELTAKNIGRTLLFQGKVHAKVELSCSRCLEKFSFKIKAPYQEEFFLLRREDQEETAGVILETARPYRGKFIDLTDTVIETILLGMPMKALCDENCMGFCNICGVDLNKENCNCRESELDPRLSVLSSFFKNNGSN